MITKEILLQHGFHQQFYLGMPINYFVKDNVLFSLVDQQIETDNPNEFVCKCDNIDHLKAIYKEMTGEILQKINE